MSNQAHLPFLVVHGAIVSKLLLILLTAVTTRLLIGRNAPRSSWLGIGVVLAGVWYVLLFSFGSACLDSRDAPRFDEHSFAAEVAAATPVRAKALRILAEDADRSAVDAQSVAYARALHDLANTPAPSRRAQK